MTSNLESQTKSITSETFAQESENASNYRPSVPIYVYRQLVEELEATKINLDALKTQNQELIAKNQKLQEEVTKIVIASQNLRDLLQIKPDIIEPNLSNEPDKIVVETEKGTSTILVANDSALPEVVAKTNPVDEHILEVEYTESNNIKSQKSGIQGIWLIMLIIFLILTSLVGGFFVVKSLVNNDNNTN